MMAKEATLLPFLKVQVDVDLKTAAGKQQAMQEYAFRNEAFAPVYAIAILQTNSREDFCRDVTEFCNTCLFGSLSGNVTVAPAVEKEEAVQNMIDGLEYGTLAINTWAGKFTRPTFPLEQN